MTSAPKSLREANRNLASTRFLSVNCLGCLRLFSLLLEQVRGGVFGEDFLAGFYRGLKHGLIAGKIREDLDRVGILDLGDRVPGLNGGIFVVGKSALDLRH